MVSLLASRRTGVEPREEGGEDEQESRNSVNNTAGQSLTHGGVET
jgi:hypothetical protein